MYRFPQYAASHSLYARNNSASPELEWPKGSRTHGQSNCTSTLVRLSPFLYSFPSDSQLTKRPVPLIRRCRVPKIESQVPPSGPSRVHRLGRKRLRFTARRMILRVSSGWKAVILPVVTSRIPPNVKEQTTIQLSPNGKIAQERWMHAAMEGIIQNTSLKYVALLGCCLVATD